MNLFGASRQLTLSLTCIFFVTAMMATATSAETINVADHGIVPGQDVTLAVNRLIQSLKGQEDVTLVFPKGTYDFHPENAVEMYRPVANHDNGLKRMAFPIFDCRNLTIDGGGSDFMFHGRIVPIVIERSEGVTLKDFSLNWIRSFHAEMTIVEVNEEDKSFHVEIDPEKYPYKVAGGKITFQRFGQEDEIGSNMVFDPKTRAPIYHTKKYAVGRKAKVKDLGDGRLEFRDAMRHAPVVGTVLVTYGTHPTSRFVPAMHVTNSKDIRMENVTIYDAGGMGLIAERTENIDLNHLVVTSTEDRIVSTRADATHFIGCKGLINLQHCRFEHMLDDGINVHGAYVLANEYLGDNEFICEISHFQQWGLTLAEAGDNIALISRETLLPLGEMTVESVRPINEHRFAMTLSEVPDPLPSGPLSFENLSWYPDLTMRNNTIRENRARSVLVTTKGKVLIEDNYFSSQMQGILIEGDNNKWYESGAVGDVTIRNNVFENIGFARDQRYPLLASPLFTKDQRMGDGQYHRNIRFTGNTIKSFNGLIAHARSVEGLEISDNVIEKSDDYPDDDEGAAIVLEYCDSVTIANNTVNGFDKTLQVEQQGENANVTVDRNEGLAAAGE